MKFLYKYFSICGDILIWSIFKFNFQLIYMVCMKVRVVQIYFIAGYISKLSH